MLVKAGLDRIIVERLGLPKRDRETDLDDWSACSRRCAAPTDTVEIAVVGKYIELHDAYKSIYESLTHAGIANRCKVKLRKVRAEDYHRRAPTLLEGVDGVLVPGGFGERGVEGKIRAIQHARETGLPFFGICSACSARSIEFARNVSGLDGRAHVRVRRRHAAPVIHLMEDQKSTNEKGGTMRLGSFDCRSSPARSPSALYGTEVSERHRHRFEFNNATAPLRTSGHRDGRRQPEARPGRDRRAARPPVLRRRAVPPRVQERAAAPHPMFRGFVGSCRRRARASRVAASRTRTGERGRRRRSRDGPCARSSRMAPRRASARSRDHFRGARV
jgi:CTP synthase